MDSIPYLKIRETCEKVFRGKYRIYDDDLIYDTMTSIILQYKKNSTHIKNLDAWLFGAIHHHYCSYISKKDRKRKFAYEGFMSREVNGYEIFPENRLDIAKVRETIRLLGAPYNEILELRIFGDFSHKEIARKLDINEATVRKYYSRSLKKIINTFKVVSHLILLSYFL